MIRWRANFGISTTYGGQRRIMQLGLRSDVLRSGWMALLLSRFGILGPVFPKRLFFVLRTRRLDGGSGNSVPIWLFARRRASRKISRCGDFNDIRDGSRFRDILPMKP